MTLPESVEVLDPRHNEGYGGWQLPCTRDEEIAELLKELDRDGSSEINLTSREAPVLRVFAERMASLARRQESVSHLRFGLEALALAVRLGDSREALVVMPLLWKTAEVLSLDPSGEFRRVADRYESQELQEFTKRRPEDRSIESMGYVETHDESGFVYDRTW